jgi:hypothetical protein
MPLEMISVFCGAPGSLHAEGQAFLEVIGEVNEVVGHSAGILFLPLNAYNKSHPQEVVDDNTRRCAYYVLVLEDTFGANSFKYDYRYARQCIEDPNLPMKEVVVMFKKVGPLRDIEPKVEEFRKDLQAEGGARHFDFDGLEEFKARLRALLTEWIRGTAAAEAAGA